MDLDLQAAVGSERPSRTAWWELLRSLVTTGVCPVGRDTAFLSLGMHQSLHAHLHPALLQASHRSQTLSLPCPLPAHPSDTEQRHLPAACPIGTEITVGQSPWDRAELVLLSPSPQDKEGSSSPPFLACSLSACLLPEHAPWLLASPAAPQGLAMLGFGCTTWHRL